MAVQRTVEVLNPEALRTERALRAFARIAVRYAFELHLYDDLFGVDNSEQKRKCSICGRDLTGKISSKYGTKVEENSDCLQRRQELLRIQDA